MCAPHPSPPQLTCDDDCVGGCRWLWATTSPRGDGAVEVRVSLSLPPPSPQDRHRVVRSVSHDSEERLPSAGPGWAVRLTVLVHKEAADPRPLGDRCFFHSPTSLAAKAQGYSAGQVERAAKAMSEYVMEQHQMELTLGETIRCAYFCPFLMWGEMKGTFAISPDTAMRFRLPQLEQRIRVQKADEGSSAVGNAMTPR